jgi:uncharacterized cupin superfamily protein
MAEPSVPFPLLSAEAIAALPEHARQHAFNPNGVRHTRGLSDACGLQQIGVHLVRLQPGRESTEYHTHSHDEEWIYILSGRGMAEIGARTAEVKAGDFMGFVAGSPHHTMTNPFEDDLVYLVGGTRQAYDVVDYPRRGIRSYKYAGKRDNVETKNLGVAS